MRRTVVLWHVLPTGKGHYDWLVQTSQDPAALLAAFRTSQRPDAEGVTEFQAERIKDHRPLYLEYEGEISGGRGVVTRVAGGVVDDVVETERSMRVTLRFWDATRVLEGSPRTGNQWVFEVRS